jgi:hypothetical protein
VERVAHYEVRPGHRTPLVGLQVGAGALVVVVATIGAAALPSSAGAWRPAVVALALLTFTPFGTCLRAVASTTALGYLLAIGFLVNQSGELSWHGMPDVARLTLLGGAAMVGWAAGAVRRSRSRPLTVDVYTTRVGPVDPTPAAVDIRSDIYA